MTSSFQTDVDRGFDWALAAALNVDGRPRNFVFSDGNTIAGRIPKQINCLWITEQYTDLRTHSHRLNTIVHNIGIICVFYESDAPYGAALYSNAYLDVNGVSFRIEQSTLECGIYQLKLFLLGTD